MPFDGDVGPSSVGHGHCLGGVDTAFWSIQDQCLDVVGPSLSGWDLFDVGRVVGGTVVC